MKNKLIIIALGVSFKLAAQADAHDPAKMKASIEKKATAKTASEPLKEDGIDPICKMKVSKGEKLTASHKGKLFGFCSEYCKEKFEENPAKFVKD